MKTTLKNVINRLPALFLGVAVAVTLTAAAVSTKKEHNPTGRPIALNVSVDERPLPRDAKFGTSFAPVVNKVAPSVVKIHTTTTVKQTSLREFPWTDDPFLRRFFGDEFDHPRGQHRLNLPPQHGVGSGVIVTKDGYILTNN